jgi:hypothetical protein
MYIRGSTYVIDSNYRSSLKNHIYLPIGKKIKKKGSKDLEEEVQLSASYIPTPHFP